MVSDEEMPKYKHTFSSIKYLKWNDNDVSLPTRGCALCDVKHVSRRPSSDHMLCKSARGCRALLYIRYGLTFFIYKIEFFSLIDDDDNVTFINYLFFCFFLNWFFPRRLDGFKFTFLRSWTSLFSVKSIDTT